MELEAAKRLSGKGEGALLPHLELGAKTLKSCRDELRNCLWDLRSRALEESDMNEAVARTLKPYADRLGITIRFNVPRRRLSDNLVRGLTSVDIAKELDISPDMVREHTSALFRKLGAANRAEAVAIALRKHLLRI